MWVSIAIGQSNWPVELDLEELQLSVKPLDVVSIAIGQSNWPVEPDLEELFFHVRAKDNEIGP